MCTAPTEKLHLRSGPRVVPVRDLLAQWREAADLTTIPGPLLTGLPAVDEALGRWSGLCVVSGVSPHGLEALVLGMVSASTRAGHGVLWLKFAGSAAAGAEALVAREAYVAAEALGRAGGQVARLGRKVTAVAEGLAGRRLWLMDAVAATASDLEAACCEIDAEGGVEVVVLEGLGALGAGVLGALEALARRRGLVIAPVVLLEAPLNGKPLGVWSFGGLPLAPGSPELVLHAHGRGGPSGETEEFRVEVFRAGAGLERSVDSVLFGACRCLAQLEG